MVVDFINFRGLYFLVLYISYMADGILYSLRNGILGIIQSTDSVQAVAELAPPQCLHSTTATFFHPEPLNTTQVFGCKIFPLTYLSCLLKLSKEKKVRSTAVVVFISRYQYTGSSGRRDQYLCENNFLSLFNIPELGSSR